MCHIRDLHTTKFTHVLRELILRTPYTRLAAAMSSCYTETNIDEASPLPYDKRDAEWIIDGATFAEIITWDGANLAPDQVLARVAAKLQIHANKVEAFAQRFEFV
jgi:hypothetical protein